MLSGRGRVLARETIEEAAVTELGISDAVLVGLGQMDLRCFLQSTQNEKPCVLPWDPSFIFTLALCNSWCLAGYLTGIWFF